MKSLLSLLLCWVLLFAGCSRTTPPVAATVPEIPRLTKILVKYCASAGEPTLKTITNPADIKKISGIINQDRSGWTASWQDPPGKTLVLVLFDEGEFRGRVEVGGNFFNLHCADTYWSKQPTKEQTEAVLKAIDLPETCTPPVASP